MNILVVASVKSNLSNYQHEGLYVGVDRGCIYLLDQQLPLDIAVGDFDSISVKEKQKVTNAAKTLVQLQAEKDDTDLEIALSYVIQNYQYEQIKIIGALGGRIDHMLTNIYLATEAKFKAFSSKIVLIDEFNLVQYFLPGKHTITKQAGKKYVGFVQINANATLIINNAKYPLKKENNFKQIYASNEFIADKINFSFTEGMVMIIHSNDKL